MSVTPVTYKATRGVVADAEYKAVKWVGKTKSGVAITIEIPCALNKDNIDLTFAEKDDTVAAATFEGAYEDTAPISDIAPVTITCADDTVAGSGSIVLGAGLFYVGAAVSSSTPTYTQVALTRGGGQFTLEREFREINADGDPGMVKGRVVIETQRPKLKLNALTWLGATTSLWPGVAAAT